MRLSKNVVLTILSQGAEAWIPGHRSARERRPSCTLLYMRPEFPECYNDALSKHFCVRAQLKIKLSDFSGL